MAWSDADGPVGSSLQVYASSSGLKGYLPSELFEGSAMGRVDTVAVPVDPLHQPMVTSSSHRVKPWVEATLRRREGEAVHIWHYIFKCTVKLQLCNDVNREESQAPHRAVAHKDQDWEPQLLHQVLSIHSIKWVLTSDYPQGESRSHLTCGASFPAETVNGPHKWEGLSPCTWGLISGPGRRTAITALPQKGHSPSNKGTFTWTLCIPVQPDPLRADTDTGPALHRITAGSHAAVHRW